MTFTAAYAYADTLKAERKAICEAIRAIWPKVGE